MIELQMKEKEFWIEFQFYFLVFYLSNLQKPNSQNKLASLEVTIVWNYVWPTDWCKV